MVVVGAVDFAATERVAGAVDFAAAERVAGSVCSVEAEPVGGYIFRKLFLYPLIDRGFLCHTLSMGYGWGLGSIYRILHPG